MGPGLLEEEKGAEIGLLAPRESRSRGSRTAARADPARSPQILARVFNRAALERYVPRLQGALRREVRSWCATRGPVAVYEAAKVLTFRMAARILLGLRLDEAQCSELARTFEQFVENLFSLPLDVPFSGLRKVLPPLPKPSLWGSLGAPQASPLLGDGGSAQCGEAAWCGGGRRGWPLS